MILSFAVAFWRYRRNTLARSRNRSTTPYTTPAMSQTYPYGNGFGRSGRGSPFGGAGGGRLSYPAPTYGTGQTNVAPEWDPTAGFAPVRVVLCTQVANRSRVFAVLMLYYCFVNSRRCPRHTYAEWRIRHPWPRHSIALGLLRMAYLGRKKKCKNTQSVQR